MMSALLQQLEVLVGLHRRNNDMWADHFEASREKILKDPAFGCEYLMMAWHGVGGYDDGKIFDNDEDETLRKAIHPKLYKMATEIKNDKNY